jgi:L-serine dehydratase
MFISVLDLFKVGIGLLISLRKNNEHMVFLDPCISAMKKTGLDLSCKYKETSLGVLAVSFIEC